jgi:TRAP-type uncharacterized transport system substrate-binding protein
MMGKKISTDDQKWMGRDAARTLAEAERIKKDPMLSKLAAKEAKNMAKEQRESADAMAKVAKTVTPKTKPATKSSPKVGKKK